MNAQPARTPVPPPPARGRRRFQQAREAAEFLSQRDPRMARLIERIGPHRPIITPDPFVALVGSILQQQVSMSAAAAIQRRLAGLCPAGRLTPAAVLGLDPAALRAAGLSRQKALYVRGLAEAFDSGMLSAAGLRRMSDEEVIAAVTRLKGVGRWTAEMLLIFCLERPDVWPIDDLGLRKAVRNFLGMKRLPAPRTMRRAGEPWRPYRTYASWYLWRSLEGPLMPGIML